MNKIEIEQRGKPPYSVWSGRLVDEGVDLSRSEISADDLGQRSIKETFLDALKEIFDMTDAGNYIEGGNYVRDAENNIVFSVDIPEDVALLMAIDKVSFLNVIITAGRA